MHYVRYQVDGVSSYEYGLNSRLRRRPVDEERTCAPLKLASCVVGFLRRNETFFTLPLPLFPTTSLVGAELFHSFLRWLSLVTMSFQSFSNKTAPRLNVEAMWRWWRDLYIDSIVEGGKVVKRPVFLSLLFMYSCWYFQLSEFAMNWIKLKLIKFFRASTKCSGKTPRRIMVIHNPLSLL